MLINEPFVCTGIADTARLHGDVQSQLKKTVKVAIIYCLKARLTRTRLVSIDYRYKEIKWV